MGYKLKEDHVRIRTTLRQSWIWELVTGEGHVISVSEPFFDRDECEASARKHGLPLIGGRKALKGRAGPRRPPGCRIFNNGRGLWIWEEVAGDGRVAAASRVGFLTREECERDFAEHARVANATVTRFDLGASTAAPQGASATPTPARQNETGVDVSPNARIYSSTCGLWRWEMIDDSKAVICASPVAFLTREECEHDLELQTSAARGAAAASTGTEFDRDRPHE